MCIYYYIIIIILYHITEEYVNNVIYHATPKAISLDRQQTNSDATLHFRQC